MGRVIRPEEIKKQAEAMITSLKKDNLELENLLTDIEVQIETDSDESQQLELHRSLIRGTICANERAVEDHEKLIHEVGEEDLVENELKQDIEKQNENIRRYRQRHRVYEKKIHEFTTGRNREQVRKLVIYYCVQKRGCADMIRVSQQIIQQLQAKIEKIDEIERKTSRLYTSAGLLYANIDTGMSDLRSVSEDTDNRILIHTSWKETLDRAWSAR